MTKLYRNTGKNSLKSMVFGTLLLMISTVNAQNNIYIETGDITNFWRAYDLLVTASDLTDSLNIIQSEYLDRATPLFSDFIKKRRLTAMEYVQKLGKYPKFWKSIRRVTQNLEHQKDEYRRFLAPIKKRIPQRRPLEICFAIGCLRTGGTTIGSRIFIGTEMTTGHEVADLSEMQGWLRSVLEGPDKTKQLLAHETIHTLQRNRGKFDLAHAVATEGVADFLAYRLLGAPITQNDAYCYGHANEKEIFGRFRSDLKNHPKEIDRWLYQGKWKGDIPADLGYYLGYRIVERFYDQQDNSEKAVNFLLNARNYGPLIEKSAIWNDNPYVAPKQPYILFLHNRFLEEHRLDEVHAQFGRAQYTEIVQKFKDHGITVISEKRKGNVNAKEYALTVLKQIDSLISKGVEPEQITVVGTSKGGYIAQYVSTLANNPKLNFVFIACYQDSDMEQIPEINFCGNILTIYERSDPFGVSALNRFKSSHCKIVHFKEVELNTGLGHGFIFRPLPEWIGPTVEWARGHFNDDR